MLNIVGGRARCVMLNISLLNHYPTACPLSQIYSIIHLTHPPSHPPHPPSHLSPAPPTHCLYPQPPPTYPPLFSTFPTHSHLSLLYPQPQRNDFPLISNLNLTFSYNPQPLPPPPLSPLLPPTRPPTQRPSTRKRKRENPSLSGQA